MPIIPAASINAREKETLFRYPRITYGAGTGDMLPFSGTIKDQSILSDGGVEGRLIDNRTLLISPQKKHLYLTEIQ